MTRENTPLLVPSDFDGKALDAVVRVLWDTSWNEARARIERGKIEVDGAVVTDSRARVHAGSAVSFTVNARRPRPDTDLPDGAIVFSDAHVVVVRKPPGISTVPFDENETGTLDERVRAFLAKTQKGGGRPSLGIVHRIDKETSGLVVFTRTWVAKQSLSQQFRVHSTKRRYFAIVHGIPRAQTIESNLVENRGDGLRGSLEARGGRVPRGKEAAQHAVTHIAIEETLQAAAVVSCTLETGRTHQIRVHLSEAGHPLVGERVYIRDFHGDRIEAPRLMLHATELGFVHPASNREMLFTDPMPEDMKKVVARLRKQ